MKLFDSLFYHYQNENDEDSETLCAHRPVAFSSFELLPSNRN